MIALAAIAAMAAVVAVLVWYAVTAARDRRRYRRQAPAPMAGGDEVHDDDWRWPTWPE